MSRNTANSIAAAEDAAAMATNTTNTTISAMDSFIPTIPEVSADDIEAKFPHKVLTKIEGQPTYAGFFKLREEVYQNALTSKSPFGGATFGHLGVVMGAQAYTLATGNIWAIPASAGVYPTFPAAATETMKRKLMSTFISTERGIRQWEATSNLLRNQLLQAIDEEYYAELYDPIFRYETVRPNDFLAHILDNYAEIDDEVLEQNKKEFQEPPDLSLPIDVYYRKQERCKQLAADGGVPISEPDLVLQLQIHMGQTGQINSSYTKWNARQQLIESGRQERRSSELPSRKQGSSENCKETTTSKRTASPKRTKPQTTYVTRWWSRWERLSTTWQWQPQQKMIPSNQW